MDKTNEIEPMLFNTYILREKRKTKILVVITSLVL